MMFNPEVGDFLKKGDDLGTFKYGGSTCVLFCNGEIDWDDDLDIAIKYAGREVYVRPGEQIGKTPIVKK